MPPASIQCSMRNVVTELELRSIKVRSRASAKLDQAVKKLIVVKCSVNLQSCMCQVVELRMSMVELHFESSDSPKVKFVKMALSVLQLEKF